MDIWSFKNQGSNYNKFRPTYPVPFIQQPLAKVKGRSRYLDIAMGTGQLLFALAPYFQNSRGIDKSSTMIESAQEQLALFKKAHPTNSVDIGVHDALEVEKGEQPYDLITVGQALHFFYGKQALQTIKSRLAPGGTFITYGYIPKEVLSQNPKETAIYEEHYHKIKPFFHHNCDDLHTFYSDPVKYPFQEVFPHVERKVVEVPMPMTKEHYISYLRTMSGYNLYLQQGHPDTMPKLEAVCAEEVTMVFEYFRVVCSLDQ